MELQDLTVLLNQSLLAAVSLMAPNVVLDKDKREGVLYIRFEELGNVEL